MPVVRVPTMKALTHEAASITERLLNDVEALYPKAIRHRRDPYSDKQVAFHLLNRQYYSLTLEYGQHLTRALLNIMEARENFEICSGLYNALVRLGEQTGFTIKTR